MQTIPTIRFVIAVFCLLRLFHESCGQDIDLRNRLVTFTNLQGQLFKRVEIVRGDRDGVVWRMGASGGRICYTNLDAELLESWGISSNRIDVARLRAALKAASDARYRALRFKAGQAELETRAKQQAEWQAGEPARKLESQRQKDLAAIDTLRRQIENLQERAEIARALVPNKTTSDPDSVNIAIARRMQANLAEVEVNRARRRLKALEQEYEQKYGGSAKKPAGKK